MQVTKDSITTEGKLQAIIVNSGNANACTGMKGLQDAYEMRTLGAKHFGMKENYVAVASTGVIGVPLPMDIIRNGIATLIPAKEEREAHSFSEAILTTDLITKETCYEMVIDGKKVADCWCCERFRDDSSKYGNDAKFYYDRRSYRA